MQREGVRPNTKACSASSGLPKLERLSAAGVLTGTGPLTLRLQATTTRRRFPVHRFIPTFSFFTRSYVYYLPDMPDYSRQSWKTGTVSRALTSAGSARTTTDTRNHGLCFRPASTFAPAARARETSSSRRNAAATETGPSWSVRGLHPKILSSPEENGTPAGDAPDPAKVVRVVRSDANSQSFRRPRNRENDAAPKSRERSRRTASGMAGEAHPLRLSVKLHRAGETLDDPARPPSRSESGGECTAHIA
jgi:hypothetical protein